MEHDLRSAALTAATPVLQKPRKTLRARWTERHPRRERTASLKLSAVCEMSNSGGKPSNGGVGVSRSGGLSATLSMALCSWAR